MPSAWKEKIILCYLKAKGLSIIILNIFDTYIVKCILKCVLKTFIGIFWEMEIQNQNRECVGGKESISFTFLYTFKCHGRYYRK